MSSASSEIVTALDDTHLRKTGRKTPGVAYRRDLPLDKLVQYYLWR